MGEGRRRERWGGGDDYLKPVWSYLFVAAGPRIMYRYIRIFFTSQIATTSVCFRKKEEPTVSWLNPTAFRI